MLEYREMNMSDYENCIKLWEKTEGMGFLDGDTTDSISFYLERNPGMSFVCFDKEKYLLVGTILGGHDGRRGYIYHLAVSKEYRGKSIGKELVRLSIEKIKSFGIKRCIIMLKTDNQDNAKFWHKSGFVYRVDLNMYSIDM